MAGLRTHLPYELTSFIGRERELAAARDLVQGSRLVTLIGVGGSGKTRLALELASELETDFDNGAAFVELASLTDAALLGEAIVQALGLAESARRTPEETIITALRDSETLVLLDNCEHLIDACATLVERLLKECGGLRVLATSRQPFETVGEVTFPVPPISLPELGEPSLRDLEVSEAVRLFADRAARARPGFAIEHANAETIGRICHRLDGLPLAIELAAARMRSMSPDEILERLDDRLSFLAAGRAGEPRHQTLRATIDWSHDLLTDDERILFRRLSIFSGGWMLEDAEAVCAGAPIPREQIIGIHSRLIERCLVMAEPGPIGPTRHRLLETIREYGAERLAASGEETAMRANHFEHFLARAEDYYGRRMAGGSDAGLAALAAHRDNFRAALSWSVENDPEGSLRLTSALEDVWRMISAAEGWRWLQRTLPLVPDKSPHRLRALLTAGMLSAYVPAYAEGTGLLMEVASVARTTGDGLSEAWAELWLGRLAFFGDDAPRAEQHLERALLQHEALENRLGQVRALALLGLLQALVLGRTSDGEQKLERAAAIANEIGDGWGEGYARLMLGLTAAETGDLERAAEHSRAALTELSLGPILGVPLQTLARTMVESDPARATRLLGAAAGHLERTGTLEPPFVRRPAEAARERAELLLGTETAARLFDDGRKTSTDAAIAYARAEAPAGHSAPGGLSRREVQVVSLVTRGLTNRDIASTLYISVRTVESHVDHALTKLSLSNRTQLAAWAKDHLGSAYAGIP